jgi:hypothetical protein
MNSTDYEVSFWFIPLNSIHFYYTSLLSKVLNLFSALKAKEHVSREHKTAGKIIVLCIFYLGFWMPLYVVPLSLRPQVAD